MTKQNFIKEKILSYITKFQIQSNDPDILNQIENYRHLIVESENIAENIAMNLKIRGLINPDQFDEKLRIIKKSI